MDISNLHTCLLPMRDFHAPSLSFNILGKLSLSLPPSPFSAMAGSTAISQMLFGGLYELFHCNLNFDPINLIPPSQLQGDHQACKLKGCLQRLSHPFDVLLPRPSTLRTLGWADKTLTRSNTYPSQSLSLQTVIKYDLTPKSSLWGN